MKIFKQLGVAALLALSLAPAAHAFPGDYDDLDEIMPTFGWEETEVEPDDLMPTW
jgi:hypothetical protein